MGVSMDVHKDIKFGSKGNFYRRGASSSLVIGREASDFARDLGAWIVIWHCSRRYDISRSQIYQWRQAFRSGRLHSESLAVVDFLPVEVCDEKEEDEEPAIDEMRSPEAMISIELRHGRTVRFPSTLPCHEIRRLVIALEAA